MNTITPVNYTQNTAFKGSVINKKKLYYATIATSSAALLPHNVFEASPSLSLGLSLAFAGAASVFSLMASLFKEKPLKLNPEIEYKESKTLEEAAGFAKENFKIKIFKVDDLEIANWINEGLTQLSNKFKGEIYVPRKIQYKTLKDINTLGSYSLGMDTLTINKVNEEHLDAELPLLVYSIQELGLDKKYLGSWKNDFNEKLKNYKTLSKIEKQSLHFSIIRIINLLNKLAEENTDVDFSKLEEKDIFGPLYMGKFGVLFHEMGHVFDKKSATDFNYKKRTLFEKMKQTILLDETSSLKYAEFIAEVFRGYLNGDKYPDEILNLFSKLTTIKLPKN